MLTACNLGNITLCVGQLVFLLSSVNTEAASGTHLLHDTILLIQACTWKDCLSLV